MSDRNSAPSPTGPAGVRGEYGGSSRSNPIALHRWRAFADVVAGALGANVWISMVLLPTIYTGAWRTSSRMVAVFLPVLVLALGLRRRSEAILLGAFPAALLVPIVLEPQLASPSVYDPVRVGLVAIGAIAYLFGVSFFTAFHEPPTPTSVRMLSSALVAPAPRWQRRERVYWELTALSILVPMALLGYVNHSEALAANIGVMYPDQIATMTTALMAGALVLWLGIYHYAVLGALRPHRTGDGDLVEMLIQTRGEVRKGVLRPSFYVAVASALLAMVLLIAVRGRG